MNESRLLRNGALEPESAVRSFIDKLDAVTRRHDVRPQTEEEYQRLGRVGPLKDLVTKSCLPDHEMTPQNTSLLTLHGFVEDGKPLPLVANVLQSAACKVDGRWTLGSPFAETAAAEGEASTVVRGAARPGRSTATSSVLQPKMSEKAGVRPKQSGGTKPMASNLDRLEAQVDEEIRAFNADRWTWSVRLPSQALVDLNAAVAARPDDVDLRLARGFPDDVTHALRKDPGNVTARKMRGLPEDVAYLARFSSDADTGRRSLASMQPSVVEEADANT